MVQFREDGHHGEADMNTPGVIPDIGTALRITCKDKGSVLHQWLKACSVEEYYQYIWCFTVFDAHIQEAFKNKSQ